MSGGGAAALRSTTVQVISMCRPRPTMPNASAASSMLDRIGAAGFHKGMR